jgi:signal transduction histidine kinase/DNA-binding response OmpR family regulator
MQKSDKKNIWKIFFAIAAVLSVAAAFALFINDNNKRATSISINSLKDATSQSAQRIDEILDRAQKEIALTAALYEEMLEEPQVKAGDLKILTEESPFDYIEFVDRNGIELNQEGRTRDISDRYYYEDGINGNKGIDVVFSTENDEENLVVFYTPMYYEGKIIGVLTGHYTENQIDSIIYNTFFEEDSRTFLCMKDGTIIASGKGDYASKSIYDEGTFHSTLDTQVKEQLRQALLNGEEYEFQYFGTDGTGNAYVTVLDKSDWVIIQTFPSQVTSQIIREANRAGVQLLLQLIAIFVCCIAVLQVASYIRNRRLVRENTEKSYVIDGVTHLFEAFILLDFEQGTYRFLAGTKARDPQLPLAGNYDAMKKYVLDTVAEDEERKNMERLFTKEAIQKHLDENTPYLRYEYRIKHETEKWDSVNFICLKRVQQTAVEVLVTYQDVTKAKQREQRSYEALKDAYKAVESANQAKSNFLSNMSHDIRTPMNAIMGMTAIAAMNTDNPERIKDCLNKIAVSSQHLLGLINEVLDMSKIESGKMILAEEEFNLPDVIERIITMFLPQTKAKNQEFKVNIADITHEDVIGDSMRLQQIFVNILGNAVKFTPEGGNITFTISEKTSGMHGCGCYEFVFEDDGIGMEESFMEKLFEPFARAKNSIAGKVEGTGLGMPIVKNIVKMMNGDIKVESKLNVGSKFTVTVYLRLSNFKSDDVERLANLPVLVADDDQFACESACCILNEIGMSAEWVLSGQEAVKKVCDAHDASEDYSAVILDWKMPGKDGIETAREIRAKVGEKVPIIILSAFDYSEIEQEARAVGVNAFIAKPLFRSRLVYVMKTLMLGEEKADTELDMLQSKDYSGKRILLVEDNEINMEVAQELLTQAGVEVDKAVNGRIAVERVREMPAGYYSLIFMDIQMPEMNGYEATEAIRSSGRKDLETIPIVAMSADAFTDDVKHAMEVGMNGHVAKPVQIDKLLEALDHWV